MNTIGFIYSLKDYTGVRYIGKTKKTLEQRLKEHIYEALKIKKNRNYKTHWINSLSESGRLNELSIHLVQQISIGESMSDAEILHIKLHKESGCQLTNCTDGGDGVTMTEEIRMKISQTKRANPKPAPNKGKTPSLASRQKMSTSHLGKKWTEEQKRNFSQAISGEKHHMWGKFHTPESRSIMRESHLGEKRPNSSSIFTGVFYIKKTNRWIAQINLGGLKNRKTIGTYKTEIEAAQAYSNFVKKMKK